VLSFSLRSPLAEPPSVIDVSCWCFSDLTASSNMRFAHTSTRPKPTDSRLHSNCVVGAYLGTSLTIPACNGISRRSALPIKSIQQDGMQSDGNEPASRQLQDKVGGVMPAGSMLL
jgi:hypothetical protein